jgi:hypothetical protein
MIYYNTSNIGIGTHNPISKLHIYNNITVWTIASDINKVECVYDGKSKIRETELSDLIKEINTRIDIMSQSHSFEDFKINIRDWRINNIIDGDNQK